MQSLPHPLRRHPVTSESVRCPTATRNDLCQRSHRPSSQTANSWRQLRTPRQGNFKQTRVKPKAPKINKKPSPHESQCPSPILITLSIFIPFLDFFNPARQAAKKTWKKPQHCISHYTPYENPFFLPRSHDHLWAKALAFLFLHWTARWTGSTWSLGEVPFIARWMVFGKGSPSKNRFGG